MSKAASWVLPVFMAAAMGTILASPRQEPTQTAADRQAISYDKWLAAKESAERYDRDGKYVEALQNYLEYTRQAEGLGRPGLMAWGKNNSAYMIIKMHTQDPTVDLAPAKKMLDEAMATGEASENCKRLLALNMEYAKLFLRLPE
ncbi:MAG: hypothetical protein IMZ57_07345 [Acidobacteria bacterium]|nr:hypothetical protein [Acidobacteriota bacterium]